MFTFLPDAIHPFHIQLNLKWKNNHYKCADGFFFHLFILLPFVQNAFLGQTKVEASIYLPDKKEKSSTCAHAKHTRDSQQWSGFPLKIEGTIRAVNKFGKGIKRSHKSVPN
jgi:hypothetical protein